MSNNDYSSLINKCPDCGEKKIYRYGLSPSPNQDTQRYKCSSCNRTFQKEYSLNGFNPTVRTNVLEMHKSGCTHTEIKSVLGISMSSIRKITTGYKRGCIYPPCPYCKHDITRRFGRLPTGSQRYQCVQCKKTFSE